MARTAWIVTGTLSDASDLLRQLRQRIAAQRAVDLRGSRSAMSTDPLSHGGSAHKEVPPPKMPRRAKAIAEVEHLRHSEMQSISDRLARVGDLSWASAWLTAATLFGGVLVGGGLALIPFLSTNPGPSVEDERLYFIALGMTALLTVVSIVGSLTAHKERAESISAIKADFDKHILSSFDEPNGGHATPPAPSLAPGSARSKAGQGS
jgi:hypothetical protein